MSRCGIAERLARCVTEALLVACLAVSLACSEKGATPPSDSEPARSLNNVHYGSDNAQVMDVLLPAARTSATAVVVFIHGGGWEGGDKGIFTATDLAKFTARGYACVNINYRLASVPLNIHDPILSNDVSAAIDYVVAHAADYHVATDKFALVGHSAGAHLALMAAYKYNTLQRIKAVASLSGPTDLTDSTFLAVPTIRALIERYLGVTQAAQPARWTGASPVSVASAASPPTILLQGRVDGLVPYTQAELLRNRLRALGLTYDYRLFATYDHDLGYAVLNHFPDDVWDPTLAWFALYVK